MQALKTVFSSNEMISSLVDDQSAYQSQLPKNDTLKRCWVPGRFIKGIIIDKRSFLLLKNSPYSEGDKEYHNNVKMHKKVNTRKGREKTRYEWGPERWDVFPYNYILAKNDPNMIFKNLPDINFMMLYSRACFPILFWR